MLLLEKLPSCSRIISKPNHTRSGGATPTCQTAPVRCMNTSLCSALLTLQTPFPLHFTFLWSKWGSSHSCCWPRGGAALHAQYRQLVARAPSSLVTKPGGKGLYKHRTWQTTTTEMKGENRHSTLDFMESLGCSSTWQTLCSQQGIPCHSQSLAVLCSVPSSAPRKGHPQVPQQQGQEELLCGSWSAATTLLLLQQGIIRQNRNQQHF